MGKASLSLVLCFVLLLVVAAAYPQDSRVLPAPEEMLESGRGRPDLLRELSKQAALGSMHSGPVKESHAASQGPGSGNSLDALKERFFTGQAAGDNFGLSVASAGDVNGDGYSDLIVAAPSNDAGGTKAGRVYIYFGGPAVDNVLDVVLTGAAGFDNFGISAATAGDVNGDGYSDVIVGAPLNDAGGTDAGRAYIYFGGASMDNVADVIFTGAAAVDQFGWSVATAGDVNGDGYGDVIVGAYGNDAGGASAGRAYIYLGGAAMDNVADVIFTGAAELHNFGHSVAAAGDVNSDGYGDVIVGTDASKAYIYFGGPTMDNSADVILTGVASGDQFGFSVATAGDVNGDGYSDVIVGAFLNDAGGPFAGRAYIYFGGPTMDNSADVILTGAAGGDQFGRSVATAGDVNGDGYSDLIVGADFNDAGGASAGRAYIYFGGAAMDNVADIVLTGSAANDLFGISVATAGDVNGDGYSDVIVGAALNDAGGTDAGRAYLYLNSLTGTDIADEFFTGAAANDWFGYSVATAGDVNGDGYSDLIVGANQNGAGGANAGRAYIYFGGASVDNVADVILTGASGGDQFGFSVAAAGDVNGDGHSDVIVGAPLNGAGGSAAGRAYIYFGGPAMDNVADVILTGAAPGDQFSRSVATAGDVNGDGYNDVIVDAPFSGAGGSVAGKAYIYFGGSTMDNSADVILTDVAAGDQFGIPVATAGDVNGDGYSDVIAGAPFNGAGGPNAGRAYIYLGGSAMDNSADVILTGAAGGDQLGFSVATAGDVNGDGYSDVIVDAPFHDAGGPVAGRAYIYLGGPAMDNVADVIFTGAAESDRFGWSVATAGDVNSDGYSDVIVSDDLNDDGGLNAGRAYIYLGGAAMDNVADVILTGAAPGDQLGFSVATAGDVNGDGYSDVFVGAVSNDAGGFNAGRAYLYLSSSPPAVPRIAGVTDVPNDHGGFVMLRWIRSAYDIRIGGKITDYIVQRSLPPGLSGFAWENIATSHATNDPQYIYTAPTLSDSSSNRSGTTYFRVIARTANPQEYWKSMPFAGHSVDNSVPVLPQAPLLLAPGNGVVNTPLNTTLQWSSSAGASSYHIQVSTKADFSRLLVDEANHTANSLTVSGLSDFTTHYWRVTAKSAAGTSNWSDAFKFTTLAVASGTNLVANGEFGGGTSPWTFFTNGNGSFTVGSPGFLDAAAAHAAISTVGSNTQLYQAGFSLEPGASYKLRFAGYSTTGHHLSVSVHKHDVPYTSYGMENWEVPLTTSWSAFSTTFTTTNFSSTVSDARLRFSLAPFIAAGDTFVIDHAELFRALPAAEGGQIVIDSRLEQNYPNPFNPITQIRYALPHEGFVSVKVYDLIGREVMTVVQGQQSAGYHVVEWDGRNSHGQQLSSGVYLYRLEAGGFVEAKKLMIVR